MKTQDRVPRHPKQNVQVSQDPIHGGNPLQSGSSEESELEAAVMQSIALMRLLTIAATFEGEFQVLETSEEIGGAMELEIQTRNRLQAARDAILKKIYQLNPL